MHKKLIFYSMLLAVITLFGCTETSVKITADELISKTQSAYSGLQSFHETSVSEVKNFPGTDREKITKMTSELFYKKPNMYLIKTQSGEAEITITSDGLLTAFTTKNEKAPAIEAISLPISTLYQRISVKSLISPERFITEFYLLDNKIPTDLFESKTVEKKTEIINEKKCYVLQLKLKTGDLQTLWIDTKDYMIRKNHIIVSDTKSGVSAETKTEYKTVEPGKDSGVCTGNCNSCKKCVNKIEKQKAPILTAGALITSEETMTSVEPNKPIDSSFFKITASPGAKITQKSANNTENLLKGSKAPDFDLMDDTGKPASLIESRGKVTILLFWDPIYKKSLSDMKNMSEISKKYPDVKIIAITEEKNKEVRDAELTAINSALPAVYDVGGKVSSLYQIDVIPYTIIIDKNGNITEALAGQQEKEKIEKIIRHNI